MSGNFVWHLVYIFIHCLLSFLIAVWIGLRTFDNPYYEGILTNQPHGWYEIGDKTLKQKVPLLKDEARKFLLEFDSYEQRRALK